MYKTDIEYSGWSFDVFYISLLYKREYGKVKEGERRGNTVFYRNTNKWGSRVRKNEHVEYKTFYKDILCFIVTLSSGRFRKEE